MRMVGRFRSFVPGVLVAVLMLTGWLPVSAASPQKKSAQTVKKAPQPKHPQTPFAKAYLTGYEDGFAQGEADWRNSTPHDFRRSDRWQQRDGAASEEQQKGYELGFELAYSDGYYGRARNTVVPRNAEVLAKAAALADQQRARGRENREPQDRSDDDRGQRGASRPRTTGPVNISNGTELRIRLSTPITTKEGRVGDKFTAIVVQPSSYELATVEGHISTLNRAGRVSGKTEVGLAFDSLTLADGRQTRIDAELIKVYESETVKKVDEEGRVETGSRTRDAQIRGGGGAVAGAIIGGIVGGGKGAVIGAILGGAAGVGSLYVEGNKDLILDPGTEMVIRIGNPKDR
ncbi:MAG: hypothetical protein WAV20_07335 [Blastocatellia bacterium]